MCGDEPHSGDGEKSGRPRRALKRKKLRKLQEQSDRRTAEFIARRLEVIEEDLGDLIPDLQTFSHYTQIASVSYCLRTVEQLQKRYRKFAEGESWDDCD